MKHKDVEEELRRREKDFRAIVDKNADAMVVLDAKGVIQYANPAALELYNLSESELIGKMMGYPIVLNEPFQM